MTPKFASFLLTAIVLLLLLGVILKINSEPTNKIIVPKIERIIEKYRVKVNGTFHAIIDIDGQEYISVYQGGIYPLINSKPIPGRERIILKYRVKVNGTFHAIIDIDGQEYISVYQGGIIPLLKFESLTNKN